uniref:Bifunctional inhibitor/plant lipid transfer protein/seed storage helical domain-containing protein n=1 Tax=Leersia perrieri TaxID=77586 RepID=A0A0D9WW25_9ORYZ
MAAIAKPVALLFAVFAAVIATAAAQGSSSGGCTTEIVSLAPCLDYISGNSTAPPKPGCCSALAAVVKSRPECLCAVLSGGASSLGVTVNSTRALELPAACSIKTPPPSECSKVGAPVASPAPGAAPGAGNGSKATPTTGGTSSSGEIVGAGKAAYIAVVIVSAVFAMMHA